MGSKMVDSSTANWAKNGAGDSAANSLNLSRSADKDSQYFKGMLFGEGKPLGNFLGGGDLNKVAPEGVYRLGMNEAVKAGETEADRAYRGTLRDAANRGFGIDAGAALEANRKNAIDRGVMKGRAFTDAATAQHQEALSNFWGATQTAADAMNQSRNAAVSASGNAGQTYANLYGSASQQKQGTAGAAIGAMGTIGGATVTAFCPCEGGMILLADGREVPVESLHGNEEIAQMNGTGFLLAKPSPLEADCVQAQFEDGGHSDVGEGHAWALRSGGYVNTENGSGVRIAGRNSNRLIDKIVRIGKRKVYPLAVSGDHTYCCDGAWSLE